MNPNIHSYPAASISMIPMEQAKLPVKTSLVPEVPGYYVVGIRHCLVLSFAKY